jgi:hypothetical protein
VACSLQLLEHVHKVCPSRRMAHRAILPAFYGAKAHLWPFAKLATCGQHVPALATEPAPYSQVRVHHVAMAAALRAIATFALVSSKLARNWGYRQGWKTLPSGASVLWTADRLIIHGGVEIFGGLSRSGCN